MTLNLSFDERLIVLNALRQRSEKLAQFATECEQLLIRQHPSDNPDTWREQLNETQALYERLSSANQLPSQE